MPRLLCGTPAAGANGAGQPQIVKILSLLSGGCRDTSLTNGISLDTILKK